MTAVSMLRSLLVYDGANEFQHFDSSRGYHTEAAIATAKKFWSLLGKQVDGE